MDVFVLQPPPLVRRSSTRIEVTGPESISVSPFDCSFLGTLPFRSPVPPLPVLSRKFRRRVSSLLEETGVSLRNGKDRSS